MQINVTVQDANNILCEVTPPQPQIIVIDRGVAGNGIVSIVPVTISTFQYLRITYTNGTVQDVGPLTSTAYTATAPITIVGNTISLATVPIASGGTDATTAAGAIQNLLPSYTGNANKRLGLNSTATGLEWVLDGGGTVTSVAASGGTTGLTFTGSPITTSGTLTLGGTLAIANGGTGQATANGALNALLPTQTGNASKYLQTDGTNATWDAISLSTADITGILPTANGGTGLGGATPFTANGLVYASSTSALTTGSALTFNGTTFSNTGSTILGDNSADSLTVNATVTSNLIFTDNTYDIGANGATRPRNAYFSKIVTAGQGSNNDYQFLAVDYANASGGGMYDGIYTSSIKSGTYQGFGFDTRYQNAGSWQSSQTYASIIDGYQGQFRVFTNSGLTAGTPYTPTLRFSIGSNGLATFQAGVTDPSIVNNITVANQSGSTAYGGILGQRFISGDQRQGMFVKGTGSLTLLSQYYIDFLANQTSVPLAADTGLAMRINQNGTVAIGGSTANTYPLEVWKSTASSTQQDMLHLFQSAAGSAEPAIRFTTGNGLLGRVSFLTVGANAGYFQVATGDGTSAVNRLQILNNGNWNWNNVGSSSGGTAMTLNSTGLGLGTSSPASRLDVANTATPVVFSMTLTGAQRWQQIIDTTYGNWTLKDQTAGTDVLVATASTGRIGIGTSSPSAKLDVVANDTVMAYLRSSGGLANDKRFTITSGGNRVILDSSNNSTGSASDLAFTLGGSEQMRLTSTGLSIGTSSPTAKLDVRGQTFVDNVTASTSKNLSTWNVNGANYAQLYDIGTTANVLALGGSAALTTVPSTPIMAWDLDNANVGIGTSSPTVKLDIVGTSGTEQFRIGNTTGGTDFGITVTENGTAVINSAEGATGRGIQFQSGGTNTMLIDSAGNVGIGTSSPAQLLDVQSATSPTIRISNSKEWASGDSGVIAAYQFYTKDASTPNGTKIAAYINSENYAGSSVPEGILTFGTSAGGGSSTNATEKMRLDSAGNLGLGVTPSAWRTSEYKAVQVGIGASFYGRVTAGDEDKAGFSANAFYDQTDNRWEYIATDSASRYDQTGGGHYWYSAASGTAGTAISFTQAMTLNASGELLLGTTSSATSTCSIQAKTSGYSIWSINDATLNYSQFYFGGTATSGFQFIRSDGRSGGWLAFGTQDTERARIDSSGNLLVGTTSTYGGLLSVNGNIGLSGNGTSNRYIALLNETNAYAGTLMIQAGGGSIGYGGAVVMYGASHATYPGFVYIGGSAGVSSAIVFGKGGNAGPSGSEYARIDTSGNFLLGTTTNAGKLTVSGKIRTLSGDIELDSGQITTNSDANSLRLGVNGVEKARIISSSQLQVGTTQTVTDNYAGTTYPSVVSANGLAAIGLGNQGSTSRLSKNFGVAPGNTYTVRVYPSDTGYACTDIRLGVYCSAGSGSANSFFCYGGHTGAYQLNTVFNSFGGNTSVGAVSVNGAGWIQFTITITGGNAGQAVVMVDDAGATAGKTAFIVVV